MSVTTATEDVASQPPSTVDTIPGLFQLDHRYNDRGDIEILERSERVAKTKHADKPLVFRRIFDSKHKIEEKRLDINSTHILKALSEIVKYYPSHPTRFDEPLKIAAPYRLLYHHWEQLAERMEGDSGESKMHLQALLFLLEREIGPDRRAAKELEKNGFIRYSLLWTILRPGDLLLEGQGIGKRLYRFETGEYHRTAEGNYFKLEWSGTTYDGLRTGRERGKDTIQEFSGVSEIASLPVFPLAHSPKQKDVKEKLLARGRKYLDLKGLQIMRYNGDLQWLQKPPQTFFSIRSGDYAGTWQLRAVSLQSQSSG